MIRYWKTVAATIAAVGLLACFGCTVAPSSNANGNGNNPEPADGDMQSSARNTTNTTSQKPEQTPSTVNDGVAHVAGYNQELGENGIWCAPMEICWQNAMEVNGGPLLGKTPSVAALNEKAFDLSAIDDDHYYTYANKVESPEKTSAEISQALEEKFGQQSELLDGTEGEPGAWMFYSMLYRKFSYATPFVKLDDGMFEGADGSVEDSIAYFGFDSEEDATSKMCSQVEVLYYDDDESHAVMLDTQEGDRVVLVRNPRGGSSEEIFSNAMTKASQYSGKRSISDQERLRVPNIAIDVTDEMTELEGAILNDGLDEFVVDEAKQKTRLSMDNEGGEIKSEAVMTMKATAVMDGDMERPRHFDYDGEYALFLLDGNSPRNTKLIETGDYSDLMPYFAARVCNAKLFQE